MVYTRQPVLTTRRFHDGYKIVGKLTLVTDGKENTSHRFNRTSGTLVPRFLVASDRLGFVRVDRPRYEYYYAARASKSS